MYQKALLPRSKEAGNSFLFDLITYLLSMYELLDRLAMPYETEIVEVIGILPDFDNNNSDQHVVVPTIMG